GELVAGSKNTRRGVQACFLVARAISAGGPIQKPPFDAMDPLASRPWSSAAMSCCKVIVIRGGFGNGADARRAAPRESRAASSRARQATVRRISATPPSVRDPLGDPQEDVLQIHLFLLERLQPHALADEHLGQGAGVLDAILQRDAQVAFLQLL